MKKWSKWLVCYLGIVLCLCLLGGCGTKKSDGTGTGEDQLGKAQSGEWIATMHVEDHGDIVIRMFSKGAPKAVENFITHAKDGYYDGTTFHRVINDFMIQGGKPAGGEIGTSIWGEPFEDEIVENLIPIRGALCMANSGPDSNTCQFFIVQAKSANLSSASQPLTEEQKAKFEENGGCPHLVGGYTTFGQVLKGMEIVDEIASTQTDSNDQPTKEVVITSIDVTKE